ncbi:hypothetical protein [Absidia glauca]|uniref:C2H2-type domain-containing protein n=1 Tax=Absidia glauca TaxID=4829 RepID=A0A168RVI2_ABSGL|nr:hypothetical protein [Absidia glauca]
MKSQPEVSLSQDMFNFEPMDHTLAAIHIPSNTISLRGSDQLPSFDAYVRPFFLTSVYVDVSSFGSFSSAADSLVHDNAIISSSYRPLSPLANAFQDFCFLGDHDPVLLTSPVSPTLPQGASSMLLSSSACESDFSLCSTPKEETTTVASPGDWLVPSMSFSPFGLDLHTSILGAQSSPVPSFRSTVSPVPSPSPSQQTHYSADQLPLEHMHSSHDVATIMGQLFDEGGKQQPHRSAQSSSIKKQQSRRREYQCPYCGRKSNRSNNMKEHILTHDPNRPKKFSCTLCPKRFARKHDLKRHYQAHGRNIEKLMVSCGLAFHLD